MIIHSSFHDYYDIGLSYGVDTTLRWNRETKVISDEVLPEEVQMLQIPNPLRCCRKYQVGGFLVLLAGKVYEIFCVKGTSQDDYDKIITTKESKDIQEVLKSLGVKFTGKYDWEPYMWAGLSFSKRCYPRELSKEFIDNIHRQLKSPVILLKGRCYGSKGYWWPVTINPCLKDIGFQHILDPYTCFQEISMYMGGVMGNTEKEIVEVSDITQRDKKGFNDKSFKHRGSKKPRRRK